jgi:outer membrane beta-barrel protein
MRTKRNHSLLILTALTLVTSIPGAWAEDKDKGAEKHGDKQSDKVQVEAIKEKYWARGDESELGVVQNRLYTKAGKLEFGGYFGLIGSDPFLSTQAFGGILGYHFSEYMSLHLLGWATNVGPSSALKTFEETRGATANTNEAKSFLGAQATWSVLYGKLSLLGKKIIYYDFHLLGGGGMTDTESGKYFTPFAGLGQQVYLSKSVSLNVDYRLMAYKEDILEKVIPTKIGQVVDNRVNWTNAVTLGISFLLGGGENE